MTTSSGTSRPDEQPDGLLGELAALATAVGPAVAPPGTQRLLEALTGTARQAFGAHACSLALLTEDETELVYTVASGSGAAHITGLRMPSTRGIAGWVVAAQQPVAISDVRGDARFARDVAEDTGYVPTALLACPVMSEVRLLGVLTVLDRDADRPGAEDDLQLLQVFADQAAIALEGARAFGDLGRVLLTALALAAGSGGDRPDAPASLAAALQRVAEEAPPADADLAALAALFAELGAAGPEERALALRVAQDVLTYARRRSRRPGH